MHKRLFRLTVWGTRLYYPAMRLVGRLTGREALVERLIEASEENIARTQAALGLAEGED
jgi:ABC-type Fe3+-hydroxamate transport system substrate-binding protein